MPKWIVTYEVNCHGYSHVEAETKDDAENYILEQIQAPMETKWGVCKVIAEEDE